MNNLTKISIKETRDQLSQLVEEVAIAKKQFLITKFGKPKAVLMPVVSSNLYKSKKDGLVASFGSWRKKRGIKNSAKWVKRKRQQMSSRYGKVSG